MIESSELPRSVRNAVTGDRIEILASPLLGDGATLVYRCTLAPRAAGSPLHRHRTLAEDFRVERGGLRLRVDGAARLLGAGDCVAVSPGVVHGFDNPTDAPVAFVSQVSPGAGFERFLRTMYGLAADGATNAAGLPRDPRALALALEHADLLLANVPHAVQRPLLAGLGWLARASGVSRRLERYSPEIVR